MKETQLKELEAAESLLQQLHNMPPIPLQEPIIANTMAILPVKGANTITGTLHSLYSIQLFHDWFLNIDPEILIG